MPTTVHGKSGDDRLFGEANPADKPDDVAGGSGADLVHGGAGDDVLSDGPGADASRAIPATDLITPQDDGTPDHYSGGFGIDTISYVGDER